MNNKNKKNIIALIGLMGVGKTTIGLKLSEKLGYYFIDSDQEIEDKEHKSVKEIFAKNGEKYFREIEKNLIKEVLGRDENVVLSLGGGAFMDEDTRKILKKKAIIIWLDATIEEILHRVGNKDNRPLLNHKAGKREILNDLMKKRYSTYAEADLKLDVTGQNRDLIVTKITKYILEKMNSTSVHNIVKVDLGERSYDIVIGTGSVETLPDFLQEKKYSKIVLITDENVAKLHLPKLKTLLLENDIETKTIILNPGERTKSFDIFEKTCEEILQFGIDRKSLIIAFGGGVIGDLSGFVASMLLRGIDFIQIPTTLLAMVDSSVGGKTAINSKHGKNLIGSFYQPQLVICDLNFLQTLLERELRSGYAEVVKYGFIQDEKLFEFLETNHKKIFSSLGFDEKIMTQIINRSCTIKASIVACDERESSSGKRALLNFGHTFGHVFETETLYSSELLHGEAVALGMVLAAKMSLDLGMIQQQDFLRIKSHLYSVGFVTSHKKVRKNWDEKNLINHLYKDKKHEDRNLTFILLEKIGHAVVKKTVDIASFCKVLAES